MTTAEKIIEDKTGVDWTFRQSGNASRACKVMGYRRGSFYRFKESHEQGGEVALQEISSRKPVKRNRVEGHIEQAAVHMATDNPALDKPVHLMSFVRKAFLFHQEGYTPFGYGMMWRFPVNA